MQAWLEGIAGPEFAPALMWTMIALIALLVLLVAIRIVRGLTFGTFVAGGRNRKARLAVMDATAVDSQRRLVLVRRDDVEHLILIGGPTDVVVEQNIRLVAPATARRPTEEAAYAQRQQPESAPRAQAAPSARSDTPVVPTVGQPVVTPRPVAPGPVERPVEVMVTPPPAPAPIVARPSPVQAASTYRPTPTPRPVEPAAPAYRATPSPNVRQPVVPAVAHPAPTASVAVSPQPTHDLDSALLEELQVSLQNDNSGAAPSVDLSLDEEMSRLLSDLSAEKRR